MLLLLLLFHSFIETLKMQSKHVMDMITMDIVCVLNFHEVVAREIIDRIVTMIGIAIIVPQLQKDHSTEYWCPVYLHLEAGKI